MFYLFPLGGVMSGEYITIFSWKWVDFEFDWIKTQTNIPCNIIIIIKNELKSELQWTKMIIVTGNREFTSILPRNNDISRNPFS